MKLLKNLLMFFLATAVLQTHATQAPEAEEKEWTFVVFAEASVDMNQYAIKNIDDIVRGRVGKNTNVLVEWHAEGQRAWRFHCKDNAIISEGTIKLQKDMADNVYSCMQWAKETAPAKHYGLILWNHGSGILDQEWSPETSDWEYALPKEGCVNGVCGLRSLAVGFQDELTRAILFSHQTDADESQSADGVYRSSLKVSEMSFLFERIYHLLGDKKLDYLGTDACVMSMLEVMYQVQSYVHYFTGAQDCELADGYNYFEIIQGLREKHLSPSELTQKVITSYESYYNPIATIGRYTQSGVDLTTIDSLKKSVDALAQLLVSELGTSSSFRDKVYQARIKSLAFCLNPAYVDLHTFTQELETLIKKDMGSDSESSNYKKMLSLVKEIQTHIDTAVVANAAGRESARARGISIYYPTCGIDPSYKNCLFAQESSWLQFLELVQG